MSLSETQRNQNKPRHHHSIVKKRQGKKKNPRHIRSKKRSKTTKRQEIQPVHLFEQKPLVPAVLEEFFLVDFFDKVIINMTACYEMEDQEERDEEKLDKPSESEENTLTILEALLACMD